MYRLPPVDLLESTHTFPGPYTFKVIGLADRGFAARVVATVRDALAFTQDPPFSTREAVGGRHVAVTLTPQVASAEQVLHVYSCLRRMVGLVMLW